MITSSQPSWQESLSTLPWAVWISLHYDDTGQSIWWQCYKILKHYPDRHWPSSLQKVIPPIVLLVLDLIILEKQITLLSLFFLWTAISPPVIERYSLNEQDHVDVYEWVVWLIEWIERLFQSRPPTALATVVEADWTCATTWDLTEVAIRRHTQLPLWVYACRTPYHTVRYRTQGTSLEKDSGLLNSDLYRHLHASTIQSRNAVDFTVRHQSITLTDTDPPGYRKWSHTVYCFC